MWQRTKGIQEMSSPVISFIFGNKSQKSKSINKKGLGEEMLGHNN